MSHPPRPRRLLAASLLAVLAALSGCGDGSSGTDPAAARPQPEPAFAGRSVVFPDGRAVYVRSQAQRVFPASASVVDFLLALAPPERVAALPEQALDYATLPGDAAAWERLPRFTSYVAETVLARSPDLVIAAPSQDRNTSDRLEAAGIEVVVLPEVRTWKEARATLVCVGELLGLETRAQALAAELDARVAALAALEGPRRGLRAVCYSNFGTGGSSAGLGTTLHEQIVLAGLRNAYAERGGEGHGPITFEDLIALDPDVILVSQPLRAGDGTQGDRGGASEKLLRGEPALRGLRAVRDGRIVALPPALFASGSHSMVRGAEVLAAAVDALLAREAAARTGR